MERLEAELRAYADELAQHHEAYGAGEFLELLQAILQATVRHHGEETIGQMSEATVMKVIRSQVSEIIRLKRLPKLMSKRERI